MKPIEKGSDGLQGIGIDIGTTTICGVLADENGNVKKSVTLANDSAMEGENQWERMQDAEKIFLRCKEVLEQLQACSGEIGTLGISGQMHGILYVDEEGRAASPLYSWQDGRGGLVFREGKTYSEYLTRITGYQMATGYGLTTHYYNLKNGLVPEGKVKLCTIGDYISMRLSEGKTPIMHKSMAASLGMFDLAKGEFDRAALDKAGIDGSILPKVSGPEQYLSGKNGDKPAIAMALGDNQASFYGAVEEGCTVLINIGTGSQISVLTKSYDESVGVEYRPYVGNSYLIVGSPLCGGASYALLKNFFKETVRLFTGKEPEDIYSFMNQAAEEAYEKEDALEIDTRFLGSRKEPEVRGAVKNISFYNFTPGDFAIGILRGMGMELYEIYQKIPEEYRRTNMITGSGNGIRRNPLLKRVLEDMFGKEIRIPQYEEEAAYGAARYAMDLYGE